ncbi:MAG: ABC transporter permease [Candidatus Heimdallarchaeota archaeon]|nr:ABC transporter permease [Candidatus Heimdallarchaeota archaeon]
MKKEKEKSKQLRALLKKDLRLLFRKRVAIFVFGGPFIMMFLLIGLPSLFSSQQTMVLLICSDDQLYSGVNIGNAVVDNITNYFSVDPSIEVQPVLNFSAVKGTENFGIYIPSNFSFLIISETDTPSYFEVDATQSLFSESIFNTIYAITHNVIATVLANRTLPVIQTIEEPPTSLPEEQLLGPKAAAIAMPLSYMIFLLIALNSGSYSNIGFAREKRMRTMEVLLSYTKKHNQLVISKTITALVASLGSTLSYVLGIVAATSLTGGGSEGIFAIFGLNMQLLNVWDIIVVVIFGVLALLISTLITMAIDSNITREASERLSPLLSIGLAMFFYFVAMTNPLGASTSLVINPFYWCYRLALLAISGKFNFEILIYLALIIAIIGLLIFFATRGIQKEKSLYLE